MSTSIVADEVQPSPKGQWARRYLIAGLVTTGGVDLAAGYLAWRLVRPGESLFWPTLAVALIMALPASAWCYRLYSRRWRKRRRALALSVVASCVVPILWSFFGVLPVSVMGSSTAAHLIQSLQQSGYHGCRVASKGSVGFLTAPFEVCVHRDGANTMVSFSTMDLHRGYAYVEGPTNLDWFPDQCATELLLAHWWVFYVRPPTSMNCPFGVWGHGGG